MGLILKMSAVSWCQQLSSNISNWDSMVWPLLWRYVLKTHKRRLKLNFHHKSKLYKHNERSPHTDVQPNQSMQQQQQQQQQQYGWLLNHGWISNLVDFSIKHWQSSLRYNWWPWKGPVAGVIIKPHTRLFATKTYQPIMIWQFPLWEGRICNCNCNPGN